MLGNERIDLDKLTKSELLLLKKRRDFFCLQCKKAVIFKNGTRKRAHFSHAKEGSSTSNPESASHLLVKHSLAKWLEKQQLIVEVEKRFSKIDRIADVYFEYQNSRYVLEIQKSPMSDLEFNQRMTDYHSINVIVLWIFVGEIFEKKNQYRLPPVMLGRDITPLMHFCVKTARLQIFEKPVFLTTRDIYAKPTCGTLNAFSIKNLFETKQETVHFDSNWLEVKRTFRKRGWFYASKSEKKLLEQCLIRGFNLSTLPTEVGWPVAGDGMRKNLFIWQAYILLIIMKYFEIGSVFSLNDLLNHLQTEYKMRRSEAIHIQVLSYMKWLMMFGVVKKEKASFKYVKKPEILSTLEVATKKDEQFIAIVRQFWTT